MLGGWTPGPCPPGCRGPSGAFQEMGAPGPSSVPSSVGHAASFSTQLWPEGHVFLQASPSLLGTPRTQVPIFQEPSTDPPLPGILGQELRAWGSWGGGRGRTVRLLFLLLGRGSAGPHRASSLLCSPDPGTARTARWPPRACG